MYNITSMQDLRGAIAYVLSGAPNRFRQEDYWASDEQMDLARAFEMLRRGVDFACSNGREPVRPLLEDILNSALAAYRAGNASLGSCKLNDFREAIFGPEKSE